jgi:signal transduction histidine kinase
MESLASTIAHELRSSVLGITSAAQLLRYSLPADPIAEKSLGRILQESERLSSLHEALSEYAIEIPPRFVVIDPDELWRKVLDGMRGAFEASSMTAVHTRPTRPSERLIDEDQMIRAFERIIHHSIARSQPGSEVVVTSALVGEDWQSIISTRNHGEDHRPTAVEFERSNLWIALANRTLVAHGGEVIEDSSTHPPLRLSIRLPAAKPLHE